MRQSEDGRSDTFPLGHLVILLLKQKKKGLQCAFIMRCKTSTLGPFAPSAFIIFSEKTISLTRYSLACYVTSCQQSAVSTSFLAKTGMKHTHNNRKGGDGTEHEQAVRSITNEDTSKMSTMLPSFQCKTYISRRRSSGDSA
jgi:hypothetical protein